MNKKISLREGFYNLLSNTKFSDSKDEIIYLYDLAKSSLDDLQMEKK